MVIHLGPDRDSARGPMVHPAGARAAYGGAEVHDLASGGSSIATARRLLEAGGCKYDT